MNLEPNSTTIISIVTSMGFGMLVTLIATRKKIKAETMLAQMQALYTEVQAYSTMLADLKSQGGLLAEQVLQLQKKEADYLKIIGQQNERERELTKEVALMRKEITMLKSKLKQYEQAEKTGN